MPTRRGSKNGPQSHVFRDMGRSAAMKTYKTLNPAVKAVGSAMKSGAESYLKGVDSVAKKINSVVPTDMQRSRGRRRR